MTFRHSRHSKLWGLYMSSSGQTPQAQPQGPQAQPTQQAQTPAQPTPAQQVQTPPPAIQVVVTPSQPSQPSTEDLDRLLTLIASLKKLQKEARDIKEEYKLCFENPNSLKCPTIGFCRLLGEKIQEIREARDLLVSEFIDFTAEAKITSKQFLELVDKAFAVNLNFDKNCNDKPGTPFELTVKKYIEAFNTAQENLLSDNTLSTFIDISFKLWYQWYSQRHGDGQGGGRE